MLSLSATPVVGLPQFEGWSQVSQNPHNSYAQLVCAFAVHGEHAGNVGRDVAQAISERTLASGQELYEFLNQLVASVADQGCELTCAACLLSPTKSVLASRGGAILLRRDRKVGRALQSDGDLQMVEGSHRTDDTWVLMTAGAADFVNEVEQKLLQGYDTDSIVTSIVSSVHALEDSSLSALAFVTQSAVAQGQSPVQTSVIETQDSSPVEDQLPSDLPTVEEPDSEATEIVIEAELQAAPPIFTKSLPVLQKAVGLVRTTTSQVGGRIWTGMIWIGSSIANNLRQKLSREPRPPEGVGSLTEQKLYIHSLGKPKQNLIKLGLLIVAGLALAVIIWQVRAYRLRVSAAETLVAPYYASLEEIKTQAASNPLAAREKVKQVVSELEQMERDAQEDRLTKPKVAMALEFARAVHDEISGQEDLAELPVYYDMRLASSEFVASSVTGWERPQTDDAGKPVAIDVTKDGVVRAAFLDREQGKLLVLDMVTKKVSVADVAGIGEIKDIRLTESSALVLADGLHILKMDQISGETPLANTQVVPAGDSNQAATLLGNFSDFLYVFNPVKRNIFRYASGKDGYSQPVGWLQSTLGVQFEDVVSMAVDGDLWLATKQGEIKRYTRGVAVPFQIVGLPTPFSTPIQLATTPDSPTIYVLEPAKKRLILLTKKDGAFLREVQSSSLASATGIVVSEHLRTVYAVSGSIVFEVKL